MRMRKKKHSAERIARCSGLLIQDPTACFGAEETIFGGRRPLLLEIGCGKGGFCVELSRRSPDSGIIAVERIPDVAMFALEKATAAEGRPDNLRFIIGNAEYLCDWFAPGTFRRIYRYFSDPWPKKGYFKRRLTSPAYLERYGTLLEPGGELFFKTDNEPLFDWSLEQFGAAGLETLYVTRDLHSSDLCAGNIETEYERRFAADGKPIFAAGVRFPAKTETGSEAADGDR